VAEQAPIWRGVFTEPYGDGKPTKFLGLTIPEYFTADFYVVDTSSRKLKVTKENIKKFKCVRYTFLLHVTKAGTVDIINVQIHGARKYESHIVTTSRPYDLSLTGGVQIRHREHLFRYGSWFISIAVQACVQTSKLKRRKGGGYAWTIGDRVAVEGARLEKIINTLKKPNHRKIDGSFLEDFARLYKELVLRGDRTPIKTLNKIYYSEKHPKQVQAYATRCRKLGLIAPAEPGRNSKVRKQTTKKGR